MKLIDVIQNTLHTDKAKRRYEMCLSCNHFSLIDKKCLECGCFMQLKVMMPTAQCPKRKW